MVSAANQMATSGFSVGALARAQELQQRIFFTLLALLAYRVGTHIPLPGIDAAAWQGVFEKQSGGMLDMFNMFAGGALARMSIFAINIMPYISASIIMSLLSHMMPSLDAMKKEGETGRKRLNQYTRYLTIALAAAQAYGLAVGLESSAGAVIDPGFYFRITTVITIVGGTVFLMWLGEQITSRGIGNGISLLIFTGIVAGLPRAVAGLMELGRTDALSTPTILGICVMVVLVIAFIVLMETAQRRLPVQYPKRMVGGNRMTQGGMNHMPLKLNTSGVIPPIFASSLLLLPMTLIGFTGAANSGNPIIETISRYMQHGQPAFMAFYAGLIVFFTFFYTAIVFNPDETADNLRKQGGVVLGYRPGKATADHIDYVLTRITVIGALYLTFVCLLPEFAISKMSLPFYLGGTSLLIVVNVAIDTMTQIQSHMIAQQYEGLIRKSQIKGQKNRDTKAAKLSERTKS